MKNLTQQQESAATVGINPDRERERLFGKFNDYPPNMVEIPESEFWRTFFQTVLDAPSYRQMNRPLSKHREMYEGRKNRYTGEAYPLNNGPMVEAKLFIIDEHLGLMVTNQHEYDKDYGFIPRFWKFAAHWPEWEAVREKSRMHLHVSRCKVCGQERSIDSSG